MRASPQGRTTVPGLALAAPGALAASLWLGGVTGLEAQKGKAPAEMPPPRPVVALADTAVPASVTGSAVTGPAATGSLPVPVPAARPDSVGAAPPVMPDGSAPEISAVRDAIGAYRKGDLAAGDRIRARLEGGIGTLLDWAAIRFGGAAVDFDRLAAFLKQNPDWPGTTWARRRAEDLLIAERRPPEFVRAFFSRERPQSAAGKVALAQAFMADGLKEDAAALVREAWRNDNFGRELESRILNDFSELLTTADHRFRMERLLFKESYEAAKRAADYAGKGFDTLVKARAAVAAKAGNAGKLLDAVPPALRADTSYIFSRVQFLRRADKAPEAARLLAEVSRDPDILVDGDEWWTERRLVARKLLDSGDAKAAYEVASLHGAEASEKRIEAEFHSGWIALRFLNDPRAAARHFSRAGAIAATPISVARAAYWRGRAAEAAGDATLAREFYAKAAEQGITYYGQLASGKLGLSQVALKPGLDPQSEERVRAAKSPAAEAVATLYAAGLRDVAVPLIVDIARRSPNVAEIDAVGDLALAHRDARALLVLGKAATQRGLPLDEHAFPTIGIPSFEPVGDRVEPAMVHAIARQESMFEPAAQSPVGARGLMQLMPATAKATARKVGLEFDLTRLVDATYNAQLGAAHLGELMEYWKGSYILTFASYNAGPGNVRKWIEAYGDPRRPEVDAIDWVERIPFSETRNYVQRVMENLQVYRRRLGSQSALLMESDLKRGAGAP
ncbi:lytic transglycosylase domain-containing protein [Enterovirga aerilata]|nr:transglycosylase SLT domain-containing protein [Enterovirga sp. DB1703]